MNDLFRDQNQKNYGGLTSSSLGIRTDGARATTLPSSPTPAIRASTSLSYRLHLSLDHRYRYPLPSALFIFASTCHRQRSSSLTLLSHSSSYSTPARPPIS